MMNYNDWLTTQSTKFQNIALGSKKAAAFRNGEKAVNYVEHGKPLTLDELKETHNISINGE